MLAPSNTVVDLLTEKISETGLSVIRIGNPVRVSEGQQKLTLERKMAEHGHWKETKRLKKMAAEFKNMDHKYKRNFGKAEREQLKALFEEVHKLMREIAQIEESATEDIISRA